MGRHEDALTTVERALPTEAACAYRIATVQLGQLGRKDDAENLLLAYLARHPRAETAATVAEVRWRRRDDVGAADILAHPPVALGRREFRDVGDRFADVFRRRPAGDVKGALEALLKAGIDARSLLELGPPLSKAGAHAQAFEVYALLAPNLADKAKVRAWSALRAAKGAAPAATWVNEQSIPADDLATFAYGEGLDDALWDLFPEKILDPALADRLALLRAASLVRRGERGARRQALLAQISDPLARWKALLARHLRLSGAYASWEMRLARYLLGEAGEDEIADDAVEGSRPCEAPYYLGLRAAADSRARDAAAWYRVGLECRNPAQPELAWAYRAAAQPKPETAAPAKPLQAAR
jgi:hypothetical protein